MPDFRKNRHAKNRLNQRWQQICYYFLERLNEKIFKSLPQWEQEVRIMALQLEIDELRESKTQTTHVRPELSDDYLRSIGREDMIGWPVGGDD